MKEIQIEKIRNVFNSIEILLDMIEECDKNFRWVKENESFNESISLIKDRIDRIESGVLTSFLKEFLESDIFNPTISKEVDKAQYRLTAEIKKAHIKGVPVINYKKKHERMICEIIASNLFKKLFI